MNGRYSEGGVHTWGLATSDCTGQWGNNKTVDDWTYVPINVTETLSVAGLTREIDITKTSDPADTLNPGGVVEYTVTVTNTGEVPEPNLVIEDALPAGIDSGTWTCASSGGATCPNPAGTMPLNEAVPNLPVGGQLVYTIDADVSLTPPEVVVNTASVSGSHIVCSDGSQQICYATVTNPAVPIVLILKTVEPAQADPGDTVTYIVTVRNSGTIAADGSTVTDVVPAGLTGFSAWTCEEEGGRCMPGH